MSTDALEVVPKVDVDQLDTAKPLPEIFQPFQATIEKWAAKVQSLRVTDISQKTEMEQARLARLDIKTARVNMEKTRVKLVEGLKARSSKIDAFARGYRVKMEALEEELRESEEFGIRHLAKLKADLKLVREARLKTFSESPILGDLSDLSEEAFAKILDDAKTLKQAKIDAARKTEEERKAKEEADRVERERVAAENARLKAEAIEKERLAKEQRERDAEEARKVLAEQKLRFEREQAELQRQWAEADVERVKERKAIEAKAKAEAAAAAKARAELAAAAKAAAEEKARIEAQRRAAEAAPDNFKLQAFANCIRAFEIPTLKTLKVDLAGKMEEVAQWVEAQKQEAKV